MARKHDTGWRDGRLPELHRTLDIPMPMAGMTFPMFEYDRGEPVGLINYIRRGDTLPRGPGVADAYAALGDLRSNLGVELPFITAIYDPRNWAFRLFAHNKAAIRLLGTDVWLNCTELHFARLLYHMRGRAMLAPSILADFGVEFSEASWLGYEGQQRVVGWPGQDMSARRRAYEPESVMDEYNRWRRVPFNDRAPCADIDLAVVSDATRQVSLLVEFKRDGAHVDANHHTCKALSRFRDADNREMPAVIAKYRYDTDAPRFWVLCLNNEARNLLWWVMTSTGAVTDAWVPDDWTYMDLGRWVAFVEHAKSM